MWLSPLTVKLKARDKKGLGELNPVPFAAAIVNCIGWTIFAMITTDYFMFFANIFGIVIGSYCTLSSIILLNKSTTLTDAEETNVTCVEAIMLSGISSWLILVAFVTFYLLPRDKDMATSVMRALCDITMICFYASPLSTLRHVLRTKDLSSLHIPSLCANFCNAVLWAEYGIAVGCVSVWIPHVLGLIISAIQVMLFMTYGNIILRASTVSAPSSPFKKTQHNKSPYLHLSSPAFTESPLFSTAKEVC